MKTIDKYTPKQIQDIREGMQLTQREWAERFGVNIRTIQRWEQPEAQPGHRYPRGPALMILRELEARWRTQRKTRGER